METGKQQFTSLLQILTVEAVDTKFMDETTKQPLKRHTARCILLNDDGSVNTVGSMRVPKPLVDKVKPGTFRAGFALAVLDYGDRKGEVQAMLVSLQEVKSAVNASPAKVAA